MTEFMTWGRTHRSTPHRVETPASEDEVRGSVLRARAEGLTVKPVGSWHSFTDIACTDGVQLDLARLTGVVRADADTGLVTLRAGTRLHAIPGLLDPLGRAMSNMGDVDRQSVSGALATGTHGTGLRYGALASLVRGVRVVTGTGEVLDVGPEDPRLPAVSLGLGALGVVTELTVQTSPAFALHAQERPEPVDRAVDTFVERSRTHDHVEFFWFPGTRTALTKINTRLPGDAPLAPLPGWRRRLDDDLLGNRVFGALCRAGAWRPGIVPLVNRAATRLIGNREYTDRSHKVYITSRQVPFRETEYAVPLEALPTVAREVMSLVERRRWKVSFPLEFRASAGDDRWLSPSYDRDTGYVAAHRYWGDPEDGFLSSVEDVLIAHDGRPHWGKLHRLTAAELAPRYPRFGDFVALRDQLDPDRVFANAYLERVLGA